MPLNPLLAPLNTEQILFSDEAMRKIHSSSEEATNHRAHLLLIGTRSGSLVWIQEILNSSSLGRFIFKEDALPNEMDLKGRIRGYSYALERYTPYRHLGWLWFSYTDELPTAPTQQRREALTKDAHWQINSLTHQVWPLVVLTARKRRKAVQLKAFEIREGQAVEIPVHLPFQP